MKSYGALILLPFLLSLNVALAKGRNKNGSTGSTSRAPANSSSGKECYSNDGGKTYSCDGDATAGQGVTYGSSQPKPLTAQECQGIGIANVEDCNRRNTQQNAASNNDLSEEAKLAKMPKDEFMQFCQQQAPAGTNCSDEYESRHMAANANAEGSGSEAKCKADGGTMTDAGCVSSNSKDDSNSEDRNNSANANICIEAHAEAADSCNSESKSWMSGLNDVVSTLGTAASQVSQSSCGGIAAAQTGAASSLAAFQLMCNSAMKKCTEACMGSTNPADVTALADCKKIGVKAADANKSVASAMLTLKSSVAACQNAFGSMDQQATAYCTSNPSACALNPMMQIQGSSAQADQAGAPIPGFNLDSTGTSGSGTSGLKLSDLGDETDTGIGTINPSKPGEDPGGNKGGGHVGSSTGGQGGSEGNGRGGAKKEGFLSNVLSGFFGGGGGSGGGGLFSKLFGNGNKNDAYASSNSGVKKIGPDLRQFLPGALKDPMRNRGIAGQFIGQDGMAGPHSDIWKNINNRYQYKRASLVP